MSTSYTSLLGLALPTTGELTGAWGDVVNDYLTKYVDASVAGTQTISGSQTAVTLSTTNGSSLVQAGSASAGSAQYMVLNCTGNPASMLTITAPASSKAYIVLNATSTNQSVKLVGAGPTTGVTVAAGDKALVAWNGSDFVRVGASAGGSNTQIQYNSSGNLAGSANLTFDGSNLQVGSQGDLRWGDSDNSNWVAFQAPATVASNVTWTLPSTDGSNGQLLSTNGSGTLSWSTVTTSAAGSTTQVQYNSGGAFAGSANLTFDGTILTADTITAKLKAYSEAVTTATVSTSTYNLDTSLTNIFDITLSNNVTFTFTNPPASGTSRSVTVILRQGSPGSRTATFTNAKYSDGILPVLSTGTNQVDVLTFFTVNGGTFWFGTFAMANVS